MRKQNSVSKDQNGLVSILVTLIIMIVLSLLVLGFAQSTRREQRQTLDRQLFSQANYAAETGLNNVQQFIKDQLASGATIGTYDKCTTGGPTNFLNRPEANPNVDGPSGNVSYTCALINAKPKELIWQHIGSDSSLAFPFKPESASTDIKIGWQDADVVSSTYAACTDIPGTFRPQSPAGPGSWNCQAGLLRVDLTPVSGLLTRTGLVDNTQNFVLYPRNAPGFNTAAYASLGHGGIVPVTCNAANTPRHCQITITIPAGDYFVRIRPVYRAANINISTGGGLIGMKEAQAVVDVTGKANDILKRLQARMSINALESVTNTTFDYSIQSIDTICKLGAILPGGTPPIINTDISGDPSCP